MRLFISLLFDQNLSYTLPNKTLRYFTQSHAVKGPGGPSNNSFHSIIIFFLLQSTSRITSNGDRDLSFLAAAPTPQGTFFTSIPIGSQSTCSNAYYSVFRHTIQMNKVCRPAPSRQATVTQLTPSCQSPSGIVSCTRWPSSPTWRSSEASRVSTNEGKRGARRGGKCCNGMVCL